MQEQLIPPVGDEPIPADIRTVGNAFRISLALFDRDGKILYMNRSFARECGVDADRAVGQPETYFTGDPMLPDVFLYQRMICRTIRRMDGFVFITAIPMFDEAGAIRFVGMTMENEAALNEVRRSFEALVASTERSVHIQSAADRYAAILRPLMGRHQSMVRLREFLKQIGPSSASVLITGESGCGKEVAADCIQALSSRSEQPYVKINCAAIPAHLLESELFGYEPGAFTGANAKGKKGLLEVANGGTLFLDEIGDMPPELQPKLLRALQHGEVYRIGSTKVRHTDVRIIAATNVDLNQKIVEGKFREDLYYRLAVIPVRIPPLRERKSDIFLLASYYLSIYCGKYNRNLVFPDDIEELLKSYDWPGNVRELQNVVEYYVVCSPTSEGLSCEQLQTVFRHPVTGPGRPGSTLEDKLDAYEKQLLQEALEEEKSLRRAAKRLGIDASTLSRKARKYGLALHRESGA